MTARIAIVIFPLSFLAALAVARAEAVAQPKAANVDIAERQTGLHALRGQYSRKREGASTRSRKVMHRLRQRTSPSRHHAKRTTGSTVLKGPSARRGYKRVSDLVNFPTFFPGIGVLYVRPNTLPTGPFLAFDRSDRLISTIYMIPLEDMENHKTFEKLAGFAGKGDHVTLHFNSGHPGVDMPHYHVVIWHVSEKDEARVAK